MDWLREKADALDADYEISQKAGALADAAAEKGDHLYAVSLCPCVSLLHSLSLLLSMVLSHSLVVSVGVVSQCELCLSASCVSAGVVSQWEHWLTTQLRRPRHSTTSMASGEQKLRLTHY